MIHQLQIAIFFEFIIFLMVIVMNIVKRNTTTVFAYFLQSLSLVIVLTMQALQEKSNELFIIIIVILIIKVLIAPYLFLRLVKKSKINIASVTYLNVPMTLGVLVLLAVFSASDVFSPLMSLLPHQQGLSLFLFGGIFMSMFLIINRKGVLSEVIGILSLENCIFSLSKFLGIHELLFLEIGLLFDVLFWLLIASSFANMIYRHYGSLEITQMRELKK